MSSPSGISDPLDVVMHANEGIAQFEPGLDRENRFCMECADSVLMKANGCM